MIAALTNHLWQSTIFALGAGLVAWALRTNGAHVRHRVWLVASLKFLVPFTVLMQIGAVITPSRPATVNEPSPTVALAVTRVAQPFAPATGAVRDAAPVAAQPRTNWLVIGVSAIWICGVVALVAVRIRGWREIRAALVASRPFVDRFNSLPVDARSVPGLLEPGVVGIWKPVLLLPEGIDQHLTPAQLDAVIEHELCHVRRRDNLTALVQMGIEAVCWFHPLVWWIGARMVEERERACDEHVLRVLRDPDSYAQGIVRVCRRYVESPLACVAGVTGASLKQRIRNITTGQVGAQLTLMRKIALIAAATAGFAAPLVAGAITAPRQQPDQSTTSSMKFDVASIKPNNSGSGQMALNSEPGGRLVATNVTLRDLVTTAYDLPAFRLVGGPDWLTKDHFDVEAKAPAGAPSNIFQPILKGGPTVGELMLRALLADRFKLEVHNETRQLPMNELVFAKPGTLGPAMTRSTRQCTGFDGDAASPREAPPCGLQLMTGRLMSGGVTLADVAAWLSRALEEVVVDRTGSTDRFEFTLTWTPDRIPQALSKKAGSKLWNAIDDDGPPLPTALREQLGLKLESKTGPVSVLVIDRASRLIPN